MAFQPLTGSINTPQNNGFQPLTTHATGNPGYVAPKATPQVSTPPSFVQSIWNKAVSFFSNPPEVHTTGQLGLISPVPQKQTLPQAQKTPLQNAGNFLGNTAAGILNIPSEASKGTANLITKGSTNTPQENLGDIGAMIQLPLLFLGGESAIATGAKALGKDAIASVAKQFGKNAIIGGGFGLGTGLQSGTQITNTKDYITNLLKNIGISAGIAAGADIGIKGIGAGVTHIAIPLVKGASEKAGAVFVKNASTNPAIEHIQLDPKVAQSTVAGNDKVAASPVGKAIMKESVNAQKQEAQVGITVKSDGKYTLPGGEKVDIATVPAYKPEAKTPVYANKAAIDKNYQDALTGASNAHEGAQITNEFVDQQIKSGKDLESTRAVLNKQLKNQTNTGNYKKDYAFTQQLKNDTTEGEYIRSLQDNVYKLNQAIMKKTTTDLKIEGKNPDLLDIGKTLSKNIGKSIAQFKVEGKAAGAFVTAHNPTESFARFKGAMQELSDTYGGHYREINDMITSGQITEKEYGTYQNNYTESQNYQGKQGINDKNSQNANVQGNQSQAASTENGVTAQNSTQPKGNTTGNQISNEHAANGADVNANTQSNEQSRSRTSNTETNGKSSGSSESKLNTPSKIAKSIEQKAVDANLTKKFDKIAGYDKITIKDQSEKATNLVNGDIEHARAILRGDEPLPEGLKGTSLITAMEEYAKQNPSVDLYHEIANSPLVTGTSHAAQELRLAAEREPDSATAHLQELAAAKKAAVEQKTGMSIDKAVQKEVTTIKNSVKTVSKKDWQSFVNSIAC